MIKSIVYSLSLLIFFSTLTNAQEINSGYKVTATVLAEQSHKPLPYVTVSVINAADSTVMVTNTTASTGMCQLIVNKSGTYLLKYTLVGFIPAYSHLFSLNKDINLITMDVMNLKEDIKLLQEVTIKSNKPLVRFFDDKVVLNVQGNASFLGSTPVDVLKRAPGVMISSSNIQINGRSNILILIDGKKQFVNSEQAMAYLQNITQENIKEIEIITNPSAKYQNEGSGGVINIVTSKPLSDGLKGAASFSMSQGKYIRYTPGINLTLSKAKTVITGSYNFIKNNIYTYSSFAQRENNEQSSLYLTNSTKSLDHNNLHIVRINIDYTLGKSDLLSFSSNGNWTGGTGNNTSTSRSYFLPGGPLTVSQLTQSNPNNKVIFSNLYYSAKRDSDRKQFNVNINYGYYANKPQINYLTSSDLPGTNTSVQNLSDFRQSKIDILSGDVNYSLRLRKNKTFEAGLRIDYTTNHSYVNFDTVTAAGNVPNPYLTTISNYKEAIPAFFSTYKAQLKHLSYELGVRLEGTISDVQFDSEKVRVRLFNYFPTLNLSYEDSANQKTTFAFRKSIYRPPYLTMNPIILFYNDYSFFQGNPNLRPSITYGFSINQLINRRYSINFGYDLITGGITQINENIPKTGQTRQTYINLNKSSGYSLNLYAPLTITKWWEVTNNAIIYYLKYLRYDYTLFPDINKGNFSVRVSSYSSIKLPHSYFGEISLYYISPNRFNQTFYRPYLTIDAGLRRTFWKDKFTVYASVIDITNKIRREGTSYYNNITSDTYLKDDSRRFRMSLSYRFGNARANSNKIRRLGSEEQQGRTKEQ